ncbi:hypothetical protein Bbelb_181060 [Branchiostoma belcheri]|nr:hypothetical protein Bbelb_181060 [Branchiostoma belcheri]
MVGESSAVFWRPYLAMCNRGFLNLASSPSWLGRVFFGVADVLSRPPELGSPAYHSYRAVCSAGRRKTIRAPKTACPNHDRLDTRLAIGFSLNNCQSRRTSQHE